MYISGDALVDYRSIYWLTVGRLSVNCRPIVSRLPTDSWPIYRSIVSCVDFLRRWLNYILWIWNLKDLSLKPSQPIHCKSSCHLVALFDLSCALSIFRGHHLVVNIHTVVTQCEISVTRKKRVYLRISSGYFLYFSIRTLWKHILVWSFYVMLLIFTPDTSIL